MIRYRKEPLRLPTHQIQVAITAERCFEFLLDTTFAASQQVPARIQPMARLGLLFAVKWRLAPC